MPGSPEAAGDARTRRARAAAACMAAAASLRAAAGGERANWGEKWEAHKLGCVEFDWVRIKRVNWARLGREFCVLGLNWTNKLAHNQICFRKKNYFGIIF